MIDVKTGADRIVIRVEIDAPRDRVWQALTEEERIAEWWGGYVSLDPRPGGASRNAGPTRAGGKWSPPVR